MSVTIGFRLGKETGMSDPFWLTDEQMDRCDRPFPRATASRARMIVGC
ncbi:hypothetical protein [Sphingomonas zeae]